MKIKTKFEQLFSKKIFVSFVLSYLIIAIIPFSALLYSYFTAQENLKEQISYSIDENLNVCLNSVNEKISMLSVVARGISESYEFGEAVARLSSDPWNYNAISLSEMLDEETRKYSEFAYMYFPDKNYFISCNGNNYSDEFADMFYSFESDEQKQLFFDRLNLSSYCAHIVTSDASGEKYIDILYSVPLLNIDGDISYNIGFRISYKAIADEIKNHTGLDDKNIYFVDKDSQIVFESESFDYDKEILYDNYTDDIITSSYKNMYFSKVFPTNSWMMVTVVPDAAITKSIAHIRYVTLLMMILCLFISVFLTRIFTTTNYKPIKMLLSSVENDDPTASDYEKIEKVLSSFQTQKQSMHQLKIDKENMEYNQFLTALVYGNTEKYIPLEKYFEKYNIEFTSDYFSVVVFFIKNPEALFKNSYDSSDIYKNMETISFIIKNVFEELITQSAKGYVFENNGLISAIINIPDQKTTVWKSELSDILKKANEFISQNFEFSFVAGISNIHTGTSELNSAFNEANSIFDFRSKLINAPAITYSETETASGSHGEISGAVTTTSRIAGMIKQYIETNYTNYDLNVSMVGRHFDMSPYYLSSIFKKEEGISILDYISKVRIEASLKYLLDGATLAEAASKNGFSNSHTYIRQFNNIMGCTPKQYANRG